MKNRYRETDVAMERIDPNTDAFNEKTIAMLSRDRCVHEKNENGWVGIV